MSAGVNRSAKNKNKYNDRDKYEDSDVESVNCCQLNVHKAKIRESRSKFHNYPEKKHRRRSCTDLWCLFVFVGCLIGWIYLGYFAVKSVPINKIFVPTDSKNRRCGVDAEVKNKPNVFYFNILECVLPKSSLFQCETPRVCVSECPKENFYFKSDVETYGIGSLKRKLICKDEFDKRLIYDKASAQRAIENKDCAEWYLESKPIGYRCLPLDAKKASQIIDSRGISNNFSDLYEFGHTVFKDLMNIWPWILVMIACAAFISFVYIIIMRWISGILIWLSIFTTVGLLSAACYFTWFQFQNISKGRQKEEPFDLQDTLIGLFWKKETWLGLFIFSVVLLAIILITIIFLRNRISLAIEMIKEGSKAVVNSWSAVGFPIFPWILQLAFTTYTILIFVYLINSGIPVKKVVGLNGSHECQCDNNYKENSYCDEQSFNEYCHVINSKLPCVTAKCVYSEKDTQKRAIYLQLYNIFMFLWSIFFASGFLQMVLASTFATYYWTFNKDSLPVFMVASAVWKVFRYHLGTISLGSLLLALLNWLRIIIEFVYNKLNKHDNYFVRCVKCCCSCFFWCLNAFLKFLNKNAYIMCASHGQNFCSSARLAFNLLMRNVLRVVILDRVSNFLLFLGRIMVTTALGLMSFYFFTKPVPSIADPLNTENGYNVEYYFVPITIVCVSAYLISSLFFGVYSMAVDTLFLCAMEDLEVNDGSSDRPYFMSKNVMKILRKKNEIKVK